MVQRPVATRENVGLRQNTQDAGRVYSSLLSARRKAQTGDYDVSPACNEPKPLEKSFPQIEHVVRFTPVMGLPFILQDAMRSKEKYQTLPTPGTLDLKMCFTAWRVVCPPPPTHHRKIGS